MLNDDTKTTEKDTALHSAISQVAADFGKDSKLFLQRFLSSRFAPVISTGSLKLDIALGIGGLPKVSDCKLNFSSSICLIVSFTYLPELECVAVKVLSVVISLPFHFTSLVYPWC